MINFKVETPKFKDVKYSILDFGAKSEVGFNNKFAIQSAIDTCSNNGGGYVIIPDRYYLTGPIELKSNVNSQYGLVGYLDNNFELVNYSINDDSITMVFNGVENKDYEQFISLSIRENYKNMDIIYKYE